MSCISVRNLHKKFKNDEILKGIDLDIERGEVISIIGASGGGKSTFLRCLIGLEDINSGTINTPDKSKMGMVFQSFNLFPHKTAVQNIMESLIVVVHRKWLFHTHKYRHHFGFLYKYRTLPPTARSANS